jgi:hypothetical protein
LGSSPVNFRFWFFSVIVGTIFENFESGHAGGSAPFTVLVDYVQSEI